MMEPKEKIVWSRLLGMGKLVIGDNFTLKATFDNGTVVEMKLSGIHVGTPAAYALMSKGTSNGRIDFGKPYGNVEWLRWDTYTSDKGDVLTVRHGGPPPSDGPAPEDTVLFPKGYRRPRKQAV